VTSAAKRAATKAATKAVTESVAKAATKAVTESVAEVAPTSDDARLPEPAGRAGRTSVMTRRGLFVALAAMPVAIVTRSALGGEPAKEANPLAPDSLDSTPRFTIDVSQHDWNLRGGNLDWEAIRNAGIVGMCARATYGDPAGFHYPSYHFGDFVR